MNARSISFTSKLLIERFAAISNNNKYDYYCARLICDNHNNILLNAKLTQCVKFPFIKDRSFSVYEQAYDVQSAGTSTTL